MKRRNALCTLAVSVSLLAARGAAETPNHVTILYDSFGKDPALTMDWGYAALIEYDGKRILFGAGGNPDILATMPRATTLTCPGWTSSLCRTATVTIWAAYVLKINPTVKIYAPKSSAVPIPDLRSKC